MTRFLGLGEVLELHRLLLEQSGGKPGVRDLGMLESAVAQPFMTFGGQDLYPTIADKGAAICFSLVMNHPFIDGNKRIGHAALETFLVLNGMELACPVEQQERQILDLAAGQVNRVEFTAWVQRHIVPLGSSAASILNRSEPNNPVRLGPCPDFIQGHRVVCWTPIDSRHHHTAKTRHMIAGSLMGPAAGLAICEYETDQDGSFFLFYCDECWEPYTDGWHKTLEDAKKQAEYEYEGATASWCDK